MIVNYAISNRRGTITLRVKSENAKNKILKLFIDPFSNKQNIYNVNDKTHTYVVYDTQLDYHFDHDTDELVYTIRPREQFKHFKWGGLFIISTIFNDNTETWFTNCVIDETEYYCMRFNLMKLICNPCGDLKNYTRLQDLMLREMMLRQAIDLVNVEDALGFYQDILWLLRCTNNGLGKCCGAIQKSGCSTCGCGSSTNCAGGACSCR